MEDQEQLIKTLDALTQRDIASTSDLSLSKGQISDLDGDLTLTWLSEVVREQDWPLKDYLLACQIFDLFLAKSNGRGGQSKVKRGQLQLTAAACMTLVLKKRSELDVKEVANSLVQYADKSISIEEIRVSDLYDSFPFVESFREQKKSLLGEKWDGSTGPNQ